MRSFFAMLWNNQDENATRNAAQFHRNALDEWGPPGVQIDGFVLYDLADQANAILPLSTSGNHGIGAIYGTLFETQALSPSTRPLRSLDDDAVEKLCASEGASLLRDYWGNYVAFIATRQGFAVIADPTSAIPCFVSTQGAVTLIFSHLERCPFIDRRSFTINESFVARLLAYDKIQNGETGLNEVRELLGGERLRIPHVAGSPELLWDPRQIARRVHEPGLDMAIEELRDITRSVVSAWANACDDISLNLSGGLDSSIVLACLANAGRSSDINAIHFRLDSSDPSESHYARAMADRVDCNLIEVLESSGHAVPAIDEHPTTVRPYRQFYGQNLLTRMGSHETLVKHSVFTGQGGDHLFLQKPGSLIFADHLCHHGLNRATGTQLLEAAHVSDQSIWAVLRQSIPHWAGKVHKNIMIAGIEAHKTAVNRHAFDNISIADSLPIWARTANGIPPAKYDQIAGMAHMVHVRDPLDKAGGRETIHPLISQPLIELSLRLPTYLLSAQGQSRGLARLAFADDLPALIRTRSSKGGASKFYLAHLTANIRIIVEALRDGELVAMGLIERADVEAFMKCDDYQIHPLGRSMLLYMRSKHGFVPGNRRSTLQTCFPQQWKCPGHDDCRRKLAASTPLRFG